MAHVTVVGASHLHVRAALAESNGRVAELAYVISSFVKFSQLCEL